MESPIRWDRIRHLVVACQDHSLAHGPFCLPESNGPPSVPPRAQSSSRGRRSVWLAFGPNNGRGPLTLARLVGGRNESCTLTRRYHTQSEGVGAAAGPLVVVRFPLKKLCRPSLPRVHPSTSYPLRLPRSLHHRSLVVWGMTLPHMVSAILICVGILLEYVVSPSSFHLLHICFHEVEVSLVLRPLGTCRRGMVHLYPHMAHQVQVVCLCLAACRPEHVVVRA